MENFALPTLLNTKVSDRIPNFINNQYEDFSNFIKKYYEFLDSNSFGDLETLVKSKEINTVDDSLIDSYYEQFLHGFPKTPQANKRLVLKLIYLIYISKGSEESFRLFFLFFYNQKIKFYYPKVDLLKVSDGKYKKQKSIKILYDGNEDFLSSTGFYIQGTSSNARAIIESSISYYVSSFRIIELFLTEIQGVFQKGEEIFLQINEEISANLIEVLSGITIENPGTGYSVGDNLNIINSYPPESQTADSITLSADNAILTSDITLGSPALVFTGISARAIVSSITKGVIESITIINGGSNYQVGEYLNFSEVLGSTSAIARIKTVNLSGSITSIEILSSGFNYKEYPNITVTSQNGNGAVLKAVGSKIGGIKTINIIDFGINYEDPPMISASSIGDGNAILTGVTGSFCEYSGEWVNQDGFISDKKYLIDSFYYQEYSYVIQLGIPFDNYSLNVKKLLHPAGMQLFGEELNNIIIDLSLERDIRIINVEDISLESIFIGNLLDIVEIVGRITNEINPSLGMTYEIFDLMKAMISFDDDNESLHYFEDILLKNFKDNNKYNGFDFVPSTIKIFDFEPASNLFDPIFSKEFD